MDLFAMQFSIPQSWCNHSKLWRRWQRRRRSLNSRDTLTRCWARRDRRRQTKRKFDVKDVESYGRQKLKFYDMRRQSGSMLHIERLIQINTTNLWHWHAWGTGRLTDSCLKHINTGRDMKRHKDTVGWTLRLREGHMIKKAKKNLKRHGERQHWRIWRDTVTACCTRRRDWRRARSGRGPSFKGPKPSRLLMPLTATLFKCVQTCFETCSNVFKAVQTCSNVL